MGGARKWMLMVLTCGWVVGVSALAGEAFRRVGGWPAVAMWLGWTASVLLTLGLWSLRPRRRVSGRGGSRFAEFRAVPEPVAEARPPEATMSQEDAIAIHLHRRAKRNRERPGSPLPLNDFGPKGEA